MRESQFATYTWQQPGEMVMVAEREHSTHVTQNSQSPHNNKCHKGCQSQVPVGAWTRDLQTSSHPEGHHKLQNSAWEAHYLCIWLEAPQGNQRICLKLNKQILLSRCSCDELQLHLVILQREVIKSSIPQGRGHHRAIYGLPAKNQVPEVLISMGHCSEAPKRALPNIVW